MIGIALLALIALAIGNRNRLSFSPVTLVSQEDSPIPTPVLEEAPPAESNVIVVPPVEVSSQWTPTPTWTPFPTWTPRPTPTRRPGPTATPFPTRGPAPTAAGRIYYVVYEVAQGENMLGKSLLYQLSLGSQAEKLTESVRMPISQPDVFYDVSPSPDGRYLLLLQPAMPGGMAHIVDRETDAHWSLAPEGEYESGRFFGWHPNSQQILFWNDRDQLVVIDVVSRERTILKLLELTVQGAAFSPDGEKIIFITKSNTSNRALWISSAVGADAKSIFDFDGSAYVFSWSPDSQYILYMGGPGVGRTAEALAKYESRGPLWIVEPDGENPRPLAGPFVAGSGYEPVWSPDSQWIVFTGLDEGEEYGCFPKRQGGIIDWPTCQFVGTGVYIENIESGELRRLASGIKPVWSPDGRWVAFLSNQSGATEVWVVRMDGSNLRQVTVDGLIKTEVVWMFKEGVGQ